MNAPLNVDVLRVGRDRIYRRRADLALHSEKEAEGFVEAVGFCFLFPVASHELPTFWEAINGSERPLPGDFYDDALDLAWSWKDTLPARRAIYYGKLLRRKPTLVSLSLLPYFYALSDNSGEPDDYLQHYHDGKLSEEAKRIYEALAEHGPQPTSRLRVLAGLPAKQGVARFDRAITELQAGLYIVKTGTSDANAWKYCYVYDLLTRRFPELPAQAADFSGNEARVALARRYLRTVIAAPADSIGRLFDWPPLVLSRTVAFLLSKGLAEEVAVPGIQGPLLTLTC